jgi:hypothetical protein
MFSAVYKDTRSINISALIYKPRTEFKHTADKACLTDKLTNLRSIAKARTETEFVTQRKTAIEEKTLFVDKMPTAAEADKRYCYKKFKLDELTNADKSFIEDETISNNQVFENTVFYKSLDDDLYNVDYILEEKQRDNRIYYLICKTVTIKMN